MAFHGGSSEEEEMAMMMNLRRGPWTEEEDLVLMNYVAAHGEGRWNSLARCAGLRRTGKSCRLRWLNYLRPDVRRGNITPEEQLLILQLHSRWGNRWSKIAQHLPGRTDNEIKNYWRTRVQKHAKQLKCDVNSKQFKDVMRFVWMPHLAERIRASAAATAAASSSLYSTDAAAAATVENNETVTPTPRDGWATQAAKPSPENSGAVGSSTSPESFGFEFSPDFVDAGDAGGMQLSELAGCWSESAYTADLGSSDLDQSVWDENLWSVEELWLEQQF